MNTNFKTVIIEGVIGIGKSTLTKELVESLGPGTLYFDEPTNGNGENPYLDRYYQDPHRWAYTMQTHLLQKRLRAHLESQWHVLNGKGHAVMDRSYFGDVCFAEIQKQDGFMTAEEYNSYLELFECMTANVLYPNFCIVLHAPLEVVEKRIKARNRSCEQSIPSEYLQKLYSNIQKMSKALESKGTKIINVDWSVNKFSKDERAESVNKLSESIRDFDKYKEYSEDITLRIT